MHRSRFGVLARTALAAAAMLLATAGTQAAADAAEDLLSGKPLLRVVTFEQAPVLDGLLDDPCWAAAEPAEPFWHFQTGAQSQHGTWAKMGIDETCIYVAFHCAEEEMERLEAVSLPPDSMSVHAHDHVEFFFMPDALAGPAYHFSVDVGGNRHDEVGSDGSWGCDWQAAVRLAEDHWTVEMHIPREAVGLTEPQMSLANFCRTRRLTPGESEGRMREDLPAPPPPPSVGAASCG